MKRNTRSIALAFSHVESRLDSIVDISMLAINEAVSGCCTTCVEKSSSRKGMGYALVRVV